MFYNRHTRGKKATKPLNVQKNYPVYKYPPTDDHLKNEELMNICEDMSRFIIKEIIHYKEMHFDPVDELAQPQYRDLVDIARQKLNKDDY